MVAKASRQRTEDPLFDQERLDRRVFADRVFLSDLPLKQLAFCAAYALGIGADKSSCPTARFNGVAAAISAGYSQKSARSTASRLLDLPRVQREIQRMIDRTAEQQNLNAQEVLRRLDAIYARCMQAVPVIDVHGSETGEYRFNAAGAVRACELIGRYLRMWQAEGSVNVQVTIEQARDFARGFARRILIAIEEHVSDPDERKRLIAMIHAEALRDG